MLKNYIKIALKVLMRRKVFTCISLFAISFTLMVLMVIAALFDHMFGSFPPEVKTERTLAINMMSLAISILSIYALVAVCSLYPGRLAAGVSPAEALHYE